MDARRVVPNASWVVQKPEEVVGGRMESQACWIASVDSAHIAQGMMVSSCAVVIIRAVGKRYPNMWEMKRASAWAVVKGCRALRFDETNM